MQKNTNSQSTTSIDLNKFKINSFEPFDSCSSESELAVVAVDLLFSCDWFKIEFLEGKRGIVKNSLKIS